MNSFLIWSDFWLGHTLSHGDLVPLAIEGRIIGKGPPGRPRVGMLDRVKDARQPLCNGQEVRLRTRTIRKDLPVGRTHANTHTHFWSIHLEGGLISRGLTITVTNWKGWKGFFCLQVLGGGGRLISRQGYKLQLTICAVSLSEWK